MIAPVRFVQQEACEDVIHQLQLQQQGSALVCNYPVAKKKVLVTVHFDIFVDTQGCLMVGGWLELSTLGYDFVHPLILPKRHCVVELLTHHHHVQAAHQGYPSMWGSIQSQFWLVGGANTFKHYWYLFWDPPRPSHHSQCPHYCIIYKLLPPLHIM